jgi:hypothetical protein
LVSEPGRALEQGCSKYRLWAIFLFRIIDVGLLGNNAVWTCRYIPAFQRNIPPPHSVTTQKININIFAMRSSCFFRNLFLAKYNKVFRNLANEVPTNVPDVLCSM